MKRSIISLLLFLPSIFFGQSRDQATEWNDYFMPGVGYKTYMPKHTEALGWYQGVIVDFVINARSKGKKSRKTGPSRIKTYSNLSIMTSSEEKAKDIFSTTFGVNLSFEAKTDRKYLIPYFGIECGGIFQRDFGSFHSTPLLGIQLVSTKYLLWNVQGGYLYSISKFDEYSGLMFNSSINVLLWK